MTRILIVEDSPTQAEALRIVLGAEGFESEVARDAEQALVLLGERPTFDAIVSDIVMPGISGYDLCRRLKAGKSTQGIPILLLTTLNDPLDIIQGLECGADNFVTKPYEPDCLVARINTMLTNHHLRAERKSKTGV